MLKLLCVTGNDMKFNIGKRAFAKHGITLEQKSAEIDEIQGEDPEIIIRDKARRAFEAVGKPLIVTDDSWSIPALRGFPGPYLKSMHRWFTPEDFLRLTRDLTDRTIYLHQYVVYQDELQTVLFSHDLRGTLLTEVRGHNGEPLMKLVSLEADNGLSVAECYDQGLSRDITGTKDAWHQAASWYAKMSTQQPKP